MSFQGRKIDHCTHVTGPALQSRAGNEYNTVCTALMVLVHFRMLNNQLTNKDPHVVPEQACLIILDSKSVACMTKNDKGIKHNRHIDRRIQVVRNCKACNMQRTV